MNFPLTILAALAIGRSTAESLDCGKHTITAGKSYTIKSPNYPKDYGKKEKCEWKLTCDDSDGIIEFSCDEFQTEERKKCKSKKSDKLKVKDSSGTIGYFCGESGPDIKTTDNYLDLKFTSNKNKKVYSGFSCTALCPAKTTTPDTKKSTISPAGGWGGECSMEIEASDGMKKYWESPKYDGTTHYPEGEYCCSLNITITSDYDMFMVNMEMVGPAAIHETSQCIDDNIVYNSADGHESTLCGDLSGEHWTEIASYNTPRAFAFTWCSVESDGATDIGFKMEITGKDTKKG